MPFRFFADDEGGSRMARVIARNRCRRCERIGSERESTDGFRGWRNMCNYLLEQRADEIRAFGVQAYLLAVDIEVRLLPRRQRDFSLGKCEFAEQGEEPIMMVRKT